jgi:hypothetical protein
MATVRPSRDVLADRYRGLTWQISDNGEDVEPTELRHDLWDVLQRLAAGTARCHPDDAGDLTAGLMAMVETTILDRLTDPAADGLADPHPWGEAMPA